MIIDWTVTIVLSALVIGGMTYTIVWGMHNFDITVNTIMSWADKQETFLQTLISCPVCFSVQISLLLSTLQCVVFGLGLWTWAAVSLLSCLASLFLLRAVDPLAERKEK